jgi:hypothetical protein
LGRSPWQQETPRRPDSVDEVSTHWGPSPVLKAGDTTVGTLVKALGNQQISTLSVTVLQC